MYESLIAVRYAKALCLAAIDENCLDEIAEKTQSLLSGINSIDSFANYMDHPSISTKQKTILFNNILKSEKENSLLRRYIGLIIQNKREAKLPDILRRFIKLYHEKKGLKNVQITTASKINEKTREQIRAFIEKNFNAKVELKEKTDKDIIGGFIVEIDDMRIDASVQKKLSNIQKRLENATMNNK